MPPRFRSVDFRPLLLGLVAAVLFGGCGGGGSGTPGQASGGGKYRTEPIPAALPPNPYPVMLGIDVLEASGFAAVKGKKIGLLTHQAGVNGRGERTVDVLFRTPATKLVALFAPEHGLDGVIEASAEFGDAKDRATELPVYSLYGNNRKPTAAQLKGLDALVVDLQDIGVRSYTFSVVMRYAMDSCFRYGVEVIVLDRPNPLGGIKVGGPPLDAEWRSGVGAFTGMPYVHGLTMGEIARFAAGEPGIMDVPEAARRKGRLTVVPMHGWKRSMAWPDTGLTFAPTSPNIPDFAAVVGYAEVGLGAEYSGFSHGLRTPYPFRLITFRNKRAEDVHADIVRLVLPGLSFRPVTVTDRQNRQIQGVLVEVNDWQAWDPTHLSFHMMRLACRYDPPNPYQRITMKQADLFNKHVGSSGWWAALLAEGANVDLARWFREWGTVAQAFQTRTTQYLIYPAAQR